MSLTLLSVSTDAKTIKGEKIGVLTGILYLAPNMISGYQVCPKATDGCKAACLYSAGLGGVYPTIPAARIRKTKMFFEQRELFMATIVNDIRSLVRKAEKHNMTPAVRLNGTSDIAWEKIAVTIDNVKYNSLMVAFPDVQFYDYTKILERTTALILSNYHLTFSLAENNMDDAVRAIETGYNVAVVVNMKKTDTKPLTWNNYPVVDGDVSDVRFTDPNGGHIVLLTAKGKAKNDTTGFVREAN